LAADTIGVLELTGSQFQLFHDTSRQRRTCVIPEAAIKLNVPEDVRKYRSKHGEQPRNNKLFYTVASFWSSLQIIS
jgi:hypothetical protein